MEMKLGDDDRRAIDLLLDHGPDHFEDGERGHVHQSGFAAVVDSDFDGRLVQVESILNLLSAMPEPEVPSHLVAKTLSYIDTASPRGTRLAPRDRIAVDDQPVA